MKKLVLSLLVVVSAANLNLAQVGMQISYGEYVKDDKTVEKTEDLRGDEEGVHVVQKGQTLFSIATAYKTTPERLKTLNNLSDNTIMVGQKLKVPGGAVNESDEVNKREMPAKTEASNDKVRQTFHKVKAGETIYSIADTYQATIDDLLEFNGLNLESKVHVGDILIVEQTKVESREVASAADSKIRGGDGSLDALGAPDTAVKSFEPIKRDVPPAKVEEPIGEMPKSEETVQETANKTVEFISPAVVLGKTIEVGSYMAVEDEETNDTRYYGYHKNLPIGSVVNLHIPNNAGFVQVKIVNRLRTDRKELIGLSPACVRLIGKDSNTATISY